MYFASIFTELELPPDQPLAENPCPAPSCVEMYRKIGLAVPLTPPVMGDLVPGGAGDKAGLKQGDRVLSIDGVVIRDGSQLRDAIRASVQADLPVKKSWTVERNGQSLALPVTGRINSETAWCKPYVRITVREFARYLFTVPTCAASAIPCWISM